MFRVNSFLTIRAIVAPESDTVAVTDGFRIDHFGYAKAAEVGGQLVDSAIFQRSALQRNERETDILRVLGVGDNAISARRATLVQPGERLDVQRVAVDRVRQTVLLDEFEDRDVASLRNQLGHQHRELHRRQAQFGRANGIAGRGIDRVQQFVDVVEDLLRGSRRPGAGLRVGVGANGAVDKAGVAKRGITDVDLLVDVHVVLQLHAVELLGIYGAAELLGAFQFGDRPAQLHAPQGQRVGGLTDVERDAGQGVGILADPGLAGTRNARGGGKAGIGEGRGFIGDGNVFAQIDVAGPIY